MSPAAAVRAGSGKKELPVWNLRAVPTATFQMLVVALVHSRLDYGNAVLVGIPAMVRCLQLVLNAAARLICHHATAR